MNFYERLMSIISSSNLLTDIIQKSYLGLSRGPSLVQIHINNECNYDCDYCYSEMNVSSKVNWVNFVERVSDIGTTKVTLLGGEPLLYDKFNEILRKCNSLGIDVRVYTNGFHVDEFIDLVKKLDIEVTFVFKFDSRECYEKYTDEEGYHKVMSNLDRCLENNINVTGHVVVTDKNFDDLDNIIEMCKDKDVILTFERFFEVDKPEVDQKLKINKEKWNEALVVIDNYYSELMNNYNLSGVLKGNTCSCYVDVLSIDVDGTVKPCPLASSAQSIGNVCNESLEDIWKMYKEKRDEWMRIPDECNKCESKNVCHGGCKNHVFKENGKYNVKDPLCDGNQIPIINHCGFVLDKVLDEK